MLLIALDNLDEVIKLIRAAADTETAREGLMKKFELSEIQAQAILDLRLRALTALERKRGSRRSTPTSASGLPSSARSMATKRV